jgi:hypothetical protein
LRRLLLRRIFETQRPGKSHAVGVGLGRLICRLFRDNGLFEAQFIGDAMTIRRRRNFSGHHPLRSPRYWFGPLCHSRRATAWRKVRTVAPGRRVGAIDTDSVATCEALGVCISKLQTGDIGNRRTLRRPAEIFRARARCWVCLVTWRGQEIVTGFRR